MPLAVAVALTFVGGVVGALLDKALGSDALVLFTVGLSIGGALGALVVARSHLLGTVASVPLLYLLIVLAGAVVSHAAGLTYTFLTNFTVKAPAVLVATAVTLVVALVRRVRRA